MNNVKYTAVSWCLQSSRITVSDKWIYYNNSVTHMCTYTVYIELLRSYAGGTGSEEWQISICHVQLCPSWHGGPHRGLWCSSHRLCCHRWAILPIDFLLPCTLKVQIPHCNCHLVVAVTSKLVVKVVIVLVHCPLLICVPTYGPVCPHSLSSLPQIVPLVRSREPVRRLAAFCSSPPTMAMPRGWSTRKANRSPNTPPLEVGPKTLLYFNYNQSTQWTTVFTTVPI